MSGVIALFAGVFWSLKIILQGQWMFLLAMIVSFIVGALSISTGNAAKEVERLSNLESDEEYEDKLATYDELISVGTKLVLYIPLLAIVVSIAAFFIIMN